MGGGNIKGPRKFKLFRKLPIELRLKIWGHAIDDGGRVIRANWELYTSENTHIPGYHLAGGPVPSVLLACQESRNEAILKFSLVHAHRPLQGNIMHRVEKVWINFNVDTIYVTRVPDSLGFLSWLYGVTLDANARHDEREDVVRHLAFPGTMMRTVFSRGEGASSGSYIQPIGHRTSLAYPLCRTHRSLVTIMVILDNSHFKEDPKPHEYTLGTPQFPMKEGSGGLFGNYRRTVDALYRLTRDFFDGPFKGKDSDKRMFERFQDNHPEWVAPTFPIYTISKAKKPS